MTERFNLFFTRARRNVTHLTVSIDQKRRRDREHAIIEVIRVSIGNYKPIRQVIPLAKLAQVDQLFSGRHWLLIAVSIVLRYAQNHESLRLEFIMPPGQIRQRVTTRTTPRRPKVEQHDLAAKISKFHRLLLDPIIRNKLRQHGFPGREILLE